MILKAALFASAFLPLGGCAKGVQYRVVSGEPAAAADPLGLAAASTCRVQLRVQRRSFIYVVEDLPGGAVRPLLPNSAVRGGADDFAADERLELPAAGTLKAPTSLILLVADVPVPGLREMLLAEKPDSAAIRRLLEQLAQAMPKELVKYVEVREGWTEVYIKQFGVDEVLLETIRVGRPGG